MYIVSFLLVTYFGFFFLRGHNFGKFLNLLAQIKKGDVDGINVRQGKLQVSKTADVTRIVTRY